MTFEIPRGVEPSTQSGSRGRGEDAPARAPRRRVRGMQGTARELPNTWPFSSAVSYHEDGPIGSALMRMGEDRRMDVDGDLLANVLGRLATRVVRGDLSAQQGVEEYKAVRDRLPDFSPARIEMDRALAQMDAPLEPAPKIWPDVPEALRKLAGDLWAVPLVRRDPSREWVPLMRLIEDFALGRTGGSRVISATLALHNRRHESYGDCGKFEIDGAVQRALDALHKLPRAALFGPRWQGWDAAEARAGGDEDGLAVVSGALSPAPLHANGWDEEAPGSPVCYHDEGLIGTAIQEMGKERRISIDGEPLANVLGVVATGVVRGTISAQEGLEGYKSIRDRLPECRARERLDWAIANMDAPAEPPPRVSEDLPEPVRRLVAELHAIPAVRRNPERELQPLLLAMSAFGAGQRAASRLIREVTALRNRRHESEGDQGKFQIDAAVTRAITALRGPR